ncbi:MAG: zinc-ribbon domain-containing protein, partial [Akkermansiaceae bacterium]|nr:zinc-ribbon domain-containing protein [Akkermansiaceae bacterium]
MKIHCPKCDQAFDVADDYIGKKVECGSCDHLFKISKDHVHVEKKRFYPGEKKGTGLSKFGGKSSADTGQVAFVPASYQSDVNPDLVGPPRPRRTIAVAGGIFLMITVIVIFLLGGGKEGPMRDVETSNRYVLSGFSALIGSSLLIYGASRNRWLGV